MKTICPMPCVGEPSFLPVNNEDITVNTLNVSMPYTGEPSFLRFIRMDIRYEILDGCQCPIRANHHFYHVISLVTELIMCCVNALYTGEPSFLPGSHRYITRETVCQCPIRANHHFYQL